jgi:hypothetical protein
MISSRSGAGSGGVETNFRHLIQSQDFFANIVPIANKRLPSPIHDNANKICQFLCFPVKFCPGGTTADRFFSVFFRNRSAACSTFDVAWIVPVLSPEDGCTRICSALSLHLHRSKFLLKK